MLGCIAFLFWCNPLSAVLQQRRQRLFRIGNKNRLAARQRHAARASAVIRHILEYFLKHSAYRGILAYYFFLAVLDHRLYFVLLRFRITAPSASQDTSFEKHYRSYSWSVMYREFLYIKNSAFYIQNILFNHINKIFPIRIRPVPYDLLYHPAKTLTAS